MRAVLDRIIVKKVKTETEKSLGGIFMPEEADQPQKRENPHKTLVGEVVEVGPGRLTDDKVHVPMPVSKGEKVVFTAFMAIPFRFDGNEYMSITEADIVAVLPGPTYTIGVDMASGESFSSEIRHTTEAEYMLPRGTPEERNRG